MTTIAARETPELSIIDAAKQLGIEPSYAYLLVRSGRLSGRKDKESGRWHVSEQSVKERQERLAR